MSSRFADRPLDGTREVHHADTMRMYDQLNQAVYSGDRYYGGVLQNALDDAIALKLPLVIKPGFQPLSAPLKAVHADRISIIATGAVVTIDRDMPSIFDLQDCSHFTLEGGWFSTGNFRVDNAIYSYNHSIQSTHNTFNGVTIEGHYGTGIRIGEQGNGQQCDHTFLSNIRLIGKMDAGQIGLYLGDGIYGNCLNHFVTGLHANGHETHVKVDHTNAYIKGAWFDTAVQDLYVESQWFGIDGIRSEDSQRFLVGAGPASYGVNFDIRNVWWNGETIASDGYWIKTGLAGCMTLDNVRVQNAAVAPRIKVIVPAPTVIHARGFMTNWPFTQAADAFDVPAATQVKIDSFIQLEHEGVVAGITSS